MFCTHFNVVDLFPVTKQLLCSYIVYLADAYLAPKSIKLYLSAIRDMYISIGLPDSREQSFLLMLKRVQEGSATHGPAPGQ